MRLVAWNILEGFLQPQNDAGHRLPFAARQDAASALIAELDPDFLILNEALHAAEAFGQFVDYAEHFQYPHHAVHLYDGAWGNAILSKYPIEDRLAQKIHRTGTKQNRGALAVKVKVGEKHLWVSTLHPHPHRRPHKRGEDFEALFSALDGNILFAGDCNAINPADEPDAANLVEAFKDFSSEDVAIASVRRMIDAGRIMFGEVLPKFGLRDLMLEANPGLIKHPTALMTIPTRLISDTQASAMRIDHIIGSERIRVKTAKPVHDPRADIASDHYPVLLDFEIA